MPYDRVMIEIYDSESPWKFRDILNPQISQWLDERLEEDAWDYDWDSGIRHITFDIQDHDIALLFKLTFG